MTQNNILIIFVGFLLLISLSEAHGLPYFCDAIGKCEVRPIFFNEILRAFWNNEIPYDFYSIYNRYFLVRTIYIFKLKNFLNNANLLYNPMISYRPLYTYGVSGLCSMLSIKVCCFFCLIFDKLLQTLKSILSKRQNNKILKHSISETRKCGLSDGTNHRPRQLFLVLSRLLSSVEYKYHKLLNSYGLTFVR